jgi:hypothetical protein
MLIYWVFIAALQRFNYTSHHLLLGDSVSNDADVWPLGTCPYLHSSFLVDPDKLITHSKAAEGTG